jgi:hypothetical protein
MWGARNQTRGWRSHRPSGSLLTVSFLGALAFACESPRIHGRLGLGDGALFDPVGVEDEGPGDDAVDGAYPREASTGQELPTRRDASQPPDDASARDATVVVADAGSRECNPACTLGTTCTAGQCTPTSDDDDLLFCLQLINGYRASINVAPLARDPALEAFAAEAARIDSESHLPHGHWLATSGGDVSYAENEIPLWPLSRYGSVQRIMELGTETMWGEGPGGGHYENIAGDYWTHAGCGVWLTSDGRVTVTQEFRN